MTIEDDKDVLFNGSPSWKALFWKYALAVVVLVGGGALLPVLSGVSALKSVALYLSGVLWLASVGYMLYLLLLRRGLSYRLTLRSIEVESGLLSKKIETVQLWKVRDLEYFQSLTDRILNVATIKVFAHDTTTPEFFLWGLPESRDMFMKLKNAVDRARSQRNVVGIVD